MRSFLTLQTLHEIKSKHDKPIGTKTIYNLLRYKYTLFSDQKIGLEFPKQSAHPRPGNMVILAIGRKFLRFILTSKQVQIDNFVLKGIAGFLLFLCYLLDMRGWLLFRYGEYRRGWLENEICGVGKKTDRGVWNVEKVECGKVGVLKLRRISLTLILYFDTKIHAIYLCHSALDSHPFFPDNLLGKWRSCEESDSRKLHSVQ